MQTLSLPVFLAADAASPLALVVPSVVMLVAIILSAVFGYWVASHVVVPERATLGSALKCFGLYIAVSLGLGIVLLALGFVAMKVDAPVVRIGIGAIAGLVVIYVVLKVPGMVYELGFLRAVGFVICAGLVNGAVVTAVDRVAFPALGGSFAQFSEMNREQRAGAQGRIDKLLAELSAQQAMAENVPPPSFATIAADSARPIAERHDALKQMYRELETRRAVMKPDDKPAIDAYNRDNALYQQLLAQLQADASKAK